MSMNSVIVFLRFIYGYFFTPPHSSQAKVCFMSAPDVGPSTVKVWDPLIRVFHWSLAFFFRLAFITEDDWMEEIHEFLANFTLLLVIAHVSGVIFNSLVEGENLVRAMITGRKKIPFSVGGWQAGAGKRFQPLG
jgi:Ni,Fe-hydrogenase I cytochrome b subunit